MLIALEAAKKELRNLVQQRQEIDGRIATVQADILQLGPLCGIEVSDPILELGLTDAIRYLLSRSRPLTPVEIKDALTKINFPLPESNPLASIHTIVRRLEKAKEVRPLASGNPGGIAFRWISKQTPPAPPVEGWIISLANDLKEKKEAK